MAENSPSKKSFPQAEETPDRTKTTPATGSMDPSETNVQPTEEPRLSGTLFLTLFFLMMVFGYWMFLYIELLNR